MPDTPRTAVVARKFGDGQLQVASDLQTHPTRTAPLCKDCGWIQRTGSGSVLGQGLCAHVSQPVEPTWGTACTPTVEARSEHGACGPGGSLFEPSPSAECTRCNGGRVRLAAPSGGRMYGPCPACRQA